ncbi:MAG TPA: hypothetical protein VGG45_01345 [Terracidiphilus sp.]|jgi:hypothetical protein
METGSSGALRSGPVRMPVYTALYLLACTVFLYAFVFVPPFTPFEISNIGDSLLYLSAGLRMFQGQLIYRDFFEFITPGMALVHVALFKLFGVRPWIPNLLVILIGLGMVSIGVAIARRLMSPALALLPSAAFLVGARELLCDPVHHWYSMLAGLLAILVLLECRTPTRIALAGAFCGISASFTQTRGFSAYVGVAVYLIWEAWSHRQEWRTALQRQALLFGSAVAVFLLINGYFIWKAGPERYFWCVVVFVLKYYPKEADWNTFAAFYNYVPHLAFTRAALYDVSMWVFWFILNPLAYVAFFISYLRNSRRLTPQQWARPMLVAVVGLFIFLCVAPAPNPNRMSVSILPALILLVWLISKAARLRRWIISACVTVIVITALHDSFRRRPERAGLFLTPGGPVMLTTQSTLEEYSWVQEHTHPGDYFYEADFPDMYFYLGLRNPTGLPRAVNNGYTTMQQVTDAIGRLEEIKPRYIYWGQGDPLVVPSWEDPADAHLQFMLDYIGTHYRRAQRFPYDDEIWERIAP